MFRTKIAFQGLLPWKFLILILFFSSCYPKGPVIIFLNDNTKIEGIAREIPDDFYGGIARLKYWDNNNIKHKFKPFEIKSYTIKGNSFESVLLKRRPNIYFYPKKIFLRRVVDGPMILYILTDLTASMNLTAFLSIPWFVSTFDYYYIKKQTDSVAHRIYKRRNEADFIPAIIIQPFNSKEFREYFSDAPEIQKKIKDRIYRRKDIYDIVVEYNLLKK